MFLSILSTFAGLYCPPSIPFYHVLTWLHLLSTLSHPTDDKGRTIFTLGVLWSDKTLPCNELCGQHFLQPSHTQKHAHTHIMHSHTKCSLWILCSFCQILIFWVGSPASCYWPLEDIPDFLSADCVSIEVKLTWSVKSYLPLHNIENIRTVIVWVSFVECLCICKEFYYKIYNNKRPKRSIDSAKKRNYKMGKLCVKEI